MIHITRASSLVNHLGICTYFVSFSCQNFQTVRFKNAQLQLQKNGFNGAPYSYKKSTQHEKSYLLKTMILKFLLQGLKLIETFHQLSDTYNFHKQVSNMKIEIYLMHLILFSNFYSMISILIIIIEHQ